MQERNGSWLQTYTGRMFWPLDPRPDEVFVEDVAHALSCLCRFGGHCLRFYCPTLEQRILTADLEWKPAGDLRVGDELIGFDENPVELGSANKKKRRFRPARVTHAEAVRREVFRLEMADGSTVRCSAEHPWLVATKISKNQAWVPTRDIAAALSTGRKRYMHRFFETWETRDTRDAGWLAGIYDGEGYFSCVDRGGVALGLSQKPGLVLSRAVSLLEAYGFSGLGYSQTGDAASSVQTIQMRGGWREAARLLGSVRPIRLLAAFRQALRAGVFAKQLNGIGRPLEIIRAYREGEDWAAGLETTTHTYFCEGFGAHNSVAEHSVLLSRIVPPHLALTGLLHDATEAYVADVPRPLKRFLPGYREAEDRVWRAVAERFGLPAEMPPEIKDADNAMLLGEARQIMAPHPAPWSVPGIPADVILRCHTPAAAEKLFLARHHELMAGCPSPAPREEGVEQ